MSGKNISKKLKTDSQGLRFDRTYLSQQLITDRPDLAKDKVLKQFKDSQWMIILNSKQVEVLPYVKKTQCEGLCLLIEQSQTQVPKETITLSNLITHIDFSNLKFVDLQTMNIRSFQGLAFITLDSLEELHIGQDHTSSLKSLNKTKFPNSLLIGLECFNPAARVDLSRMKAKKSMKKFKMGNESEIAQLEDLSRLVKMEIEDIRILTLVYDFQPKMWGKYKVYG